MQYQNFFDLKKIYLKYIILPESPCSLNLTPSWHQLFPLIAMHFYFIIQVCGGKKERRKHRLHFIENCFPNLFWNLFCLLPRQYLYYYFVLKSFYQFANTKWLNLFSFSLGGKLPKFSSLSFFSLLIPMCLKCIYNKHPHFEWRHSVFCITSISSESYAKWPSARPQQESLSMECGISSNCPQWISFLLALISDTFPGFLLIATNVQAKHEGIKTVWLSKSQPESEVCELFRPLTFMVPTWFILTNLPSDMVCYLYFKRITLHPSGPLGFVRLFLLPYT